MLLRDWIDDLQQYALRESLAGNHIPGWKAVEGRAGNRTWADPEKALTILKEKGVSEETLYEKKPKSLAQIEKITPKEIWAEIAPQYVYKPKGKPTLVPEDDPRESYTEITPQEAFK